MRMVSYELYDIFKLMKAFTTFLNEICRNIILSKYVFSESLTDNLAISYILKKKGWFNSGIAIKLTLPRKDRCFFNSFCS